ncbi:hypothetical protein [Mesorhizobium sp. LNHC252B00]|uniref:hypothetical protein n=1 Tax=Mesorhizobium sp. LNHC252B00 TaxID=1287252 RepID=UPI0012EC63F5|nr:hypothetical protein [Mesorhizobium sp. LNHC252B00]
MHAKVNGPFPPSEIAREAVHRILSTGNIDLCGGETVQMLHYLDGLMPHDIIIVAGKGRRGLWKRFSGVFRT